MKEEKLSEWGDSLQLIIRLLRFITQLLEMIFYNLKF